MRVLVCTALKQEYELIERAAEQFKQQHFVQLKLTCCSNGNDFYRLQMETRFDILFVCLSGAVGQELSIQAKKIQPDGKIVWVSDDPIFAVAAYRIQVSCFLLRPVSVAQLCETLFRCCLSDTDAPSSLLAPKASQISVCTEKPRHAIKMKRKRERKME